MYLKPMLFLFDQANFKLKKKLHDNSKQEDKKLAQKNNLNKLAKKTIKIN